ncbi:MAG: alcohol dehydrogenase catalytic domain-containing protein [Cytophagaceae bacterium]|nr:alcohol dehydrogenase catalytic domain-containing protein [Cytophagaceae bacterium]MBL0301592.1 alcohol dehydrogenase catalytic domain-containing protein [Cytophagaceae bacterium]MBL0324416.1 alcohol dehydrogenase catalytic domain-containing protein [Cytophagaceae bacterium]
MKALLLTGPNTWEIAEIPTPTPAKGQVLVKMAFAPVNPSDLSFLTGNYGLKKPFPVVPGLEGSGTVVASGGGFLANRLLNKRVACTAGSGNGTWAEYMLTDAGKCIDIPDSIDQQQASMLFVNPLTAISFIKQAKNFGANAIVISAAGSALGKMVIYHAQKAGIPVIGVIRNISGKTKLKSAGFEEIFALSEDNVFDQLKEFSKKYKKIIYFDAVSGGDIPYKILNALPDNSKMVIYGRLDLNPTEMQPQNLLFKQNIIEGYWLSKELKDKSILNVLLDISKIKKMLRSGFETQIQGVFDLENAQKAIDAYTQNMSAGKVLLKFI